VERRVARVAAIVHVALGRLLPRADLEELGRLPVVLAEVGAEPALAVVNWLHGWSPWVSGRR
jgi:hypothetical protein